MKIIAIILSLICINAIAQGVPDLERKEYPPLKPLNWCKHADGVTREQIAPCGPDTTVGSSISTAQPEPRNYVSAASADLSANYAATKAEATLNAAATPGVSDKNFMKSGLKAWLKLLAFGLIFGFIAKFLDRSFLRWFFGGIILHFILVALNIMSI